MEQARRAAEAFALAGSVTGCEPYGSGHINTTRLVTTAAGQRYILQGVNEKVFTDVPALMHNISAVTRHLSGLVDERRKCLHLVPTKDGEEYLRDADGKYWRVYEFIEDSLCLQAPERPADLYESAVAFGTFQRQLSDFPAGTLHETIPHFHDTPDRFRKFREALARDRMGRAAGCTREIDFCLEQERHAAVLQEQLRAGLLPLRVTHNDTKLNNVMLDAATRKALCVIDLETVMPGLMAYDFGDSIRFGAATAAEDERRLELAGVDFDLCATYTEGFLAAAPELTREELESLPWGARLMTLECGLRFLTDYLDGDVYFAVHRPGQNLDRCRTQLKMVAEMEKHWDRMLRIVREKSGLPAVLV